MSAPLGVARPYSEEEMAAMRSRTRFVGVWDAIDRWLATVDAERSQRVEAEHRTVSERRHVGEQRGRAVVAEADAAALRGWLEAIRDDNRGGRGEIVYDEFSYARREDEFREAARKALSSGAGAAVARVVEAARTFARADAEYDTEESADLSLTSGMQPYETKWQEALRVFREAVAALDGEAPK